MKLSLRIRGVTWPGFLGEVVLARWPLDLVGVADLEPLGEACFVFTTKAVPPTPPVSDESDPPAPIVDAGKARASPRPPTSLPEVWPKVKAPDDELVLDMARGIVAYRWDCPTVSEGVSRSQPIRLITSVRGRSPRGMGGGMTTAV